MRKHLLQDPRAGERGGLTILVVLSLLALLTVAALGMSRNSLRETMIVGTSRHAANVRQAADAGLEFAILWSDTRSTPAAPGALSYQERKAYLLDQAQEQGRYKAITSGGSDTIVASTPDYTQRFDLQLLRMGKLQPLLTSIQDERIGNDLWVVRSSGIVTMGGVGAPTFQHDKEMWLTTPAQTTSNTPAAP